MELTFRAITSLMSLSLIALFPSIIICLITGFSETINLTISPSGESSTSTRISLKNPILKIDFMSFRIILGSNISPSFVCITAKIASLSTLLLPMISK